MLLHGRQAVTQSLLFQPPGRWLARVRHSTFILLLATALATSGCSQKRPLLTPIPVKYYPAASSPSSTLLVLLPGIHDAIGKFDSHGFIETAQQSGRPCDIVTVDAHYGYYDAGTITERLHQDVILPAQQRGYSDIRIAGISLGGFGALLYANRHGKEVSTLVLLAPWLGDEQLIDSITAAGGPGDWQPQGTEDGQSLQAIWLQRKAGPAPAADFPDIYLGYGLADKFRQAHALLASTLPEDHVFTTTGGHNWSSWEQLWEQLQAAEILCGATSRLQ